MRPVIVLTAPSGSGKTTIAKRLMEAFPEVRFSVSATTRPPREDETDGEHYHFLDEDTFRQHIAEGHLLEYEEVYPGRYYGTLKSEVEGDADDPPVLLDIDVRGARTVELVTEGQALSIFVAPPSLEELERRLRSRGTEDEETLRTRLNRAEYELSFADSCDHIVVNDDLDRAVEETLSLVQEYLA